MEKHFKYKYKDFGKYSVHNAWKSWEVPMPLNRLELWYRFRCFFQKLQLLNFCRLTFIVAEFQSRAGEGTLWTQKYTFGFHKMLGNSE
jgi:hypothetical protein